MIVEHSEPGMAARHLRRGRKNFEAHGYTESCDGCIQLRAGWAPRNHNKRCRNRMEMAIAVESEDGRGRVEGSRGSTRPTSSSRATDSSRANRVAS